MKTIKTEEKKMQKMKDTNKKARKKTEKANIKDKKKQGSEKNPNHDKTDVILKNAFTS